MIWRLNEPRLMGNCVRCYYATRKRKDGSCTCARYPKWQHVDEMNEHFCGEFIATESLACVGGGA